ncbi:MAG: hypothetical protein QF449_14350 [Alphaproteobacteria bacterium]|jgi:hypothetical protein|nr:hypothetical protein [Alphaproteobacteria bacterium]MDP6819206.1 hypothetical protein [Alphaproteobacteria bacterium]|tara:strand:- start:375 stop:629 length:255 start_codon:yes stop_codon:yes gene_type:complete
MIRSVQIIIAAAVLTAFAGSAHATYCPGLITAIDEALQTRSDLGSEQLDEVKRLRDEGAALHDSRKHGQSIAVLKKALAILKQE